MKKHLVFFALCFFAVISSAQRTCPGCSTAKDQWIFSVVKDENTQGFWLSEGINPDPKSGVDWGDSIPFFFADHYHWTQPADSVGENPWSLIGDYYDANVAPPVIADRDTATTIAIPTYTHSRFDDYSMWDFIKWILFLFVLSVVGLMFYNGMVSFLARRKMQKEEVQKTPNAVLPVLTDENVNKVGPPVYADGLTDNTVLNHFENQMAREGQILPIKRKRSGRLYSREAVPVAFADNERSFPLGGVQGYEFEMILPNGTIQKRYTLKACGNDVSREEDKGIQNVLFLPDEEQPEILQPESTDQPEEITNTGAGKIEQPATEVTEFMMSVEKIMQGKKDVHIRFSSTTEGGTMIEVNSSDY